MSTNRAPLIQDLTFQVNPIDPEQSTTSSLIQSLKAHPKRALTMSSTILLGSTATSIYFLSEKFAALCDLLAQFYNQKVGTDEYCTNWAYIPPPGSDKLTGVDPCASLQEGLQNNMPAICSGILTKACNEYENSTPAIAGIAASVVLVAATLISLIALYNACQKKEHTLLIEEVKEPLNPKPAQGVIKQETAVEIADTPVEPENLEQNYFRLTK